MTPTPAPMSQPPSGAPRAAFRNAFRGAAEVASLSPSSHNCQPWAVAWLASRGARRAAAPLLGEDSESRTEGGGTRETGENQYLILALDRERQLGSLPAHAVEMLLSCGMYGQILLRALAAQGWSPDRIHFCEWEENGRWPLGGTRPPTWPPAWSPLCVIRLRHASGPVENLSELRATTHARRTNRAPYLHEAVDPAILDRLLVPSTAVAEGAEVTVRHLLADADRAGFADLVARHGGRDFSHHLAWRETHSFLRWSRADADARGDGFTLSQLFGPMSWPRRQSMRIALAPATMRVLRHVGYHRLLARQLAHIVRPTPAIVAMSFADTTPSLEDTVRAGGRLADYWLRATDAGLVLHPVSVLLQHEDLRTELQGRLRLPGRVFFVSRLGRPTADFPRSPRRAAATTFRII